MLKSIGLCVFTWSAAHGAKVYTHIFMNGTCVRCGTLENPAKSYCAENQNILPQEEAEAQSNASAFTTLVERLHQGADNLKVASPLGSLDHTAELLREAAEEIERLHGV